MARELESERGVPSEPPTELIPFIFGAVNRAILVVRTICHLRSERTSFAVVVTEDRTRDLSQAETGGHQVPPCAGHGNSLPGGQPLSCHCTFCSDVPLLEIAKRWCESSAACAKPSILLGKGIAGFSVHGLVLCGFVCFVCLRFNHSHRHWESQSRRPFCRPGVF